MTVAAPIEVGTWNYGGADRPDGGSMGLSPKLLGEGETVVLSTRTHIKALVLPVITLILICAATGFLLAVTPGGSSGNWLRGFLVLVAVVLILWRVVWLFLNWLTASYTVTNRRLVTRSGIFTRVGRDIPLYRINDVKYERDLLDRLLGCGTLVISDASQQGHSVLPDVPHVEKVHLLITDLLFGNDDGADDDGSVPPGPEPHPRPR
jgi:membrane protein YdbS with pleckstrin-like domain